MAFHFPPHDPSEKLIKDFKALWAALFLTPVHLDSALSKLHPKTKGPIASLVHPLLLRPTSLAESLGIGVAPGEPWNLSGPALVHWKPALQIAERLLPAAALGGPLRIPSDLGSWESDFPPILLQEWATEWGEGAQGLARALLKEPPLGLRAVRAVGALKLKEILGEQSKGAVDPTPSTIAPYGVFLPGYQAVMKLQAFEEGKFEIQDEGSQILALFALWPEKFAHLLSDQPGAVTWSGDIRELEREIPVDPPAWTVVDACAGAGGKTLAMADALKGRGRVYAYDTVVGKLQALRRRAARTDLRNIQAVEVVSGAEDKVVNRFRRTAQAVVVDAPCSGWGVLRRNPDAKWRFSLDVLQRLPELQLRLLSVYSGLVAPGGRLTYGTCTFRSAETVEVVAHFLQQNTEFEKAEGGFLGPGPCDGFFMQSFRRRK